MSNTQRQGSISPLVASDAVLDGLIARCEAGKRLHDKGTLPPTASWQEFDAYDGAHQVWSWMVMVFSKIRALKNLEDRLYCLLKEYETCVSISTSKRLRLERAASFNSRSRCMEEGKVAAYDAEQAELETLLGIDHWSYDEWTRDNKNGECPTPPLYSQRV